MHRRRTLAPSPPPGVKPYDLERLERERARLEDAKRRLVKSLRMSEETKRALEQDHQECMNLVDGAFKRDDTDAQGADSSTTASGDNSIVAPPALGGACSSKEPKQLRWRSSMGTRRDQLAQLGCQAFEGAVATGPGGRADAEVHAQTAATPYGSIETGAGGSGCRASLPQRPQMSASSSRAPSPTERRAMRIPSDKVAFGSRVPRQSSSPMPRRPSPRRTGSPRQRPPSARHEEMTVKGNSVVVAACSESDPVGMSGNSKEFFSAHSPLVYGSQVSPASTLSEVNRDTDLAVTCLPLEQAPRLSESFGFGSASTLKHSIRSQNGQPDVENRMPQRNCLQRVQGQSKPKGSASGSSLVAIPQPVPSSASSRASSCRAKQRPNRSRPGSPSPGTVRQGSSGRRMQNGRGPSSSPANSRPMSRRGSVGSSCAAVSANRTPTRPTSRTPAGRTPAHTPSDRTPAGQWSQTPADRTPAERTPADLSPCNSPSRCSPVGTPTASWAPSPEKACTEPSNLLVRSMQDNFDQAVQQQWQLLHQQWPHRPDTEDHQSESSAPSTPVSATLPDATFLSFADGDAQECGFDCLEMREPLSGISTATPATGAMGDPEEEERTAFEGQSSGSLEAQLPALPASPPSSAAQAAAGSVHAPMPLPLPTQPSESVLLGSATTSARLMSAAEFDELVAVVRGGSPSPRAEVTLPKPLRVMKAGDHTAEPPESQGHPLEASLLDGLTCPMLRRRSAEVIAPRAESSATPKAPGPTLARPAPLSPALSLAEPPEEMAELRLCPAEPLREWPVTASPSARARLARPATAAGAAASVVQTTPLVTTVSRRSSPASTLHMFSPTATKMQSAGAASASVSSARACVWQNGAISWAEVAQPVHKPLARGVPLDSGPADVSSPMSDGTFRAQPSSVQMPISASPPMHSDQAHPQARPTHSVAVLHGSRSMPMLPMTGDESVPPRPRIVRLQKR